MQPTRLAKQIRHDDLWVVVSHQQVFVKVLDEAVAGIAIGFPHPSCKNTPQCGVPPILMQMVVLVKNEVGFEVEAFFEGDG